MAQPITMPALSDTMSNGRLVKWTKKPGDTVKKGDVIAEIETDKAVMDVEAFEDGYLSGPLVAEGTEAPVGEVIGYIVNSTSDIARGAPSAAPAIATSGNGNAQLPPKREPLPQPADAASSVSAVLAASMGSLPSAGAQRAHRPPAAPVAAPQPAARQVRGPATDPAMVAIEAGPAYRIERASSLREAVARNMIASTVAPTFRVGAQIPLEALANAVKPRKLSLTLVLARACALTLVAHPIFNAAYTPNGLARRERVDIGIALDDGEGLITPVLRDAAGRGLPELAKDWTRLREKARTRRLAPIEYSGATFYLSNLGSFAVVESFDSIVPIGASAILSVAASRPRGASFTLACDHRVVFGADAARFLETLRQQLKDPEKLLV